MAKAKQQTDSAFDPTQYEAKDLTTSFKWQEEKVYFFKVTGPMRVSERNFGEDDDAPKGKKKAKREPPTLLPVINLETGDKLEIIASAVIKSTLERSFTGEAYIGESFRMVQHAKPPGKNYRRYTIEHLQPKN